MNTSLSEGTDILKNISIPKNSDLTIIIAPPFTHLDRLSTKLHSGIKLSGQNIHFEASGAYTGEISYKMLKETGCEYVIIGHSERRHVFGESNDTIRKKIEVAVQNKITPIICFGETWEEKNDGKTYEILEEQLVSAISNFNSPIDIILAYEPVWAIGTGKVPSVEDIDKMLDFSLNVATKNLSSGSTLSMIYGGSVNDTNAKDLIEIPNNSGFIVGGASLNVDKFNHIIKIFST